MPTDRYINQGDSSSSIKRGKGVLNLPNGNWNLAKSRSNTFPRSKRPFLDPRSIDIFRRQTRRIWLAKPQEIASRKCRCFGARFHSFTSRKSIRPRFRKGLNVTKEQPFCHIIRSAGLLRGLSWMRCGPAAGQRQPSATPKSR